ncbi:MAG: sulfatase [Planctomycetaceae bacterium]|nr:sulfatase [Planctomycetaceae bacterium]
MFENIEIARRQFLTSSASGLGAAALVNLLDADGFADSKAKSPNPLAPRNTHYPARAKNVIFIYPAGGPSQLELFDPKPVLTKRSGEQLPDSLTKDVRFAFIKKDAKLMGSKRVFRKHGECGTELSDLLPHLSTCVDDIAFVRSMHTEAFNHHPAQLMLSTGVPRFGRPSFGSWVLYGLGSESQNLPGYVVLTANRGSSGGTSNWTNGFLPSTYQGVVLRSRGEPVLNLNLPDSVSRDLQAANLNAISKLNQLQFERTADPEIESRIASYELAFRMQAAAPSALDLSEETQETLDAYGVDRPEPTDVKSQIGGGKDVYKTFARNCLYARRLIERGVRFVTLMHASWDQHGQLASALSYNARMSDQPIAALIKDLKQRGMLDDTLIVFAGEFGRTPLAQGNDGRDHHPQAFTAWMAGGGVRGGQVYGQTDDFGWRPQENPVHINDFHATLLHLLGIDHERLSKNFGGLDVRLTNVGGNVIEDLIA